jgi:hypothetical protein
MGITLIVVGIEEKIEEKGNSYEITLRVAIRRGVKFVV